MSTETFIFKKRSLRLTVLESHQLKKRLSQEHIQCKSQITEFYFFLS